MVGMNRGMVPSLLFNVSDLYTEADPGGKDHIIVRTVQRWRTGSK